MSVIHPTAAQKRTFRHFSFVPLGDISLPLECVLGSKLTAPARRLETHKGAHTPAQFSPLEMGADLKGARIAEINLVRVAWIGERGINGVGQIANAERDAQVLISGLPKSLPGISTSPPTLLRTPSAPGP